MEPSDHRHWWNGKWGRLARLDVYLRAVGDRHIVEAREGGADGTIRTWHPPTEEDALQLVDDLLSDQDQTWRELTARPPAPNPGSRSPAQAE